MPPPMSNFIPQPTTQPMSAPSGNTIELFDRLDAEWNAALDVEKDLDRLRKMLVDLTTRLKALNRGDSTRSARNSAVIERAFSSSRSLF